MAVLIFLEIRSIRLDRQQHDAEQAIAHCEQLNSFKEIVSKLESDIKSNQQHFDATMEKEKGILSTAEKVTKLSQRNLENITGADSFGYAIPFTTQGVDSGLTLRNDMDQVLSGVSVVIERVLNDCDLKAKALCVQQYDTDGVMHPIDVGTLGPHQRKALPKDIWFDSKGNGTGHYNIRVYAQNGQAIEQIWFKRSTTHPGYSYSFNVIREIHGRPRKGDFTVGETIFRTLKTVDWTEYSPSESTDGIHLYQRH